MVEGEKHGGKRSGITAALLLPLGPLGFVAMVERAASSFGGGARREAAQQRQGVDDEGRGTQALDGPATRRPMSRQGKPIHHQRRVERSFTSRLIPQPQPNPTFGTGASDAFETSWRV